MMPKFKIGDRLRAKGEGLYRPIEITGVSIYSKYDFKFLDQEGGALHEVDAAWVESAWELVNGLQRAIRKAKAWQSLSSK